MKWQWTQLLLIEYHVNILSINYINLYELECFYNNFSFRYNIEQKAIITDTKRGRDINKPYMTDSRSESRQNFYRIPLADPRIKHKKYRQQLPKKEDKKTFKKPA